MRHRVVCNELFESLREGVFNELEFARHGGVGVDHPIGDRVLCHVRIKPEDVVKSLSDKCVCPCLGVARHGKSVLLQFCICHLQSSQSHLVFCISMMFPMISTVASTAICCCVQRVCQTSWDGVQLVSRVCHDPCSHVCIDICR